MHRAATAGYDGEAVDGGKSKAKFYDQRRPGYDAAVIEELVQQLYLARARVAASSPAAVIELGAGTGKFSQPLAHRILQEDTGLSLVASEPVAGMREVLKGKLPASPRVIVSPGSATDLHEAQEAAGAEAAPSAPVPVCGVVAAQAFHWFANDATLRELSRVVSPGGILAFVWNNRDTRLKWVRDFEEIVKPLYPPEVPRQQYGEFMQPLIGEAPGAKDFAPMGVFCSSTEQRGDIEMVVGRVLSLSVVANRPVAEQDAIAERCRAVVRANLPDVDNITLPYLTHAFFFVKRPAPVSTQQASALHSPRRSSGSFWGSVRRQQIQVGGPFLTRAARNLQKVGFGTHWDFEDEPHRISSHLLTFCGRTWRPLQIASHVLADHCTGLDKTVGPS